MLGTLKGKITHEQFHNGQYFYRIIEAAPDQYSQPNSFKVKSGTQLGQVGNEVQINVRVTGFVREKPYTDKTTGQQKVFEEKIVNLEFVNLPPKK
ncbi:hypothetical protein [Pseudoteredinibacter isoporae]|uniref:Single-stranded DNA-binding protein n=1 Tax=Pseudoteredinibacter isoporae TaxID=570281 RepID=A0A7X0JX63_9GAMM|nr:hypothetical protein [Pseudoteredinibacter isoporae]MBB6523902.1 hypothetical protein [Pseudoteredinibacter isoporae]NHO89401.1 hypothetical protein [Pseudoteredinibacter isoporae]NIB22791.1 hypothetical protein [Pseudoteredinibacter isoporae]